MSRLVVPGQPRRRSMDHEDDTGLLRQRLTTQPTEHYGALPVKGGTFHYPPSGDDDHQDDTRPVDRIVQPSGEAAMPTIQEQSSGEGSKSDCPTDISESCEGLGSLYSRFLEQNADRNKQNVQPTSPSLLKQPFLPSSPAHNPTPFRGDDITGQGKALHRQDQLRLAPPALVHHLGRSKSMRVDSSTGLPAGRGLGTWGSMGGAQDRAVDQERQPSRLGSQMSVPLPAPIRSVLSSSHAAAPSRAPTHVRMGRQEVWSKFMAYEGCIQVCY